MTKSTITLRCVGCHRKHEFDISSRVPAEMPRCPHCHDFTVVVAASIQARLPPGKVLVNAPMGGVEVVDADPPHPSPRRRGSYRRRSG